MELIELQNSTYWRDDYNYSILITDYKEWGRDWDWEAWGFYNDWRDKPFDKWYLWHCSCYGPFDHKNFVSYTKEDAAKLIPDNIKEVFLKHNIIVW